MNKDGTTSTFRRLEFRDVIKRVEEEHAEEHLNPYIALEEE
tara:strand:+ start:704 stop:826 length:123 start_codon:yes stop_codon:yes gene_type:complete